jgi:bifunctional DNA-binding transcriptional regulator/antitoxin component of YhaV-PrlF toxin-antitoxin module
MTSITIPQKIDLGWVVDVPNEIADALGIAKGSIALLHVKDGRLELEMLPPPSKELVESVRQTYEQFKDAFDEMKRLGD